MSSSSMSGSTMPVMTLEQFLKEQPRLSRTDIEYIQEWLSKQPHLPHMPDLQVATFLNANQYSLERTKTCIDKFFTMRTHAPEIFGNRDLDNEVNKKQAEYILVSELPKRDANGFRVVALGLQPGDLTHFDAHRAAFLSFAMVELLIREWPACPGFTFVMDAQHLQLGHIAKASVPLLNKLLTYVQEAAPVHMEIVHIIHVGPIVERVMMLVKPFLGRELQGMLNFHSGDMESFYKVLPKDTLPVEFGGTNGSAVEMHNKLFDRLLKEKEWLKEQENQVVDENRRPGRAKDAGEVFGMEGSFKRLQID